MNNKFTGEIGSSLVVLDIALRAELEIVSLCDTNLGHNIVVQLRDGGVDDVGADLGVLSLNEIGSITVWICVSIRKVQDIHADTNETY